MKRLPKFNTNDPYNPILLCPSCGGEFLHHDDSAVEVWQRGEDELLRGCAILPGGEGVKFIPAEDNPSSRRSGVRLRFRCEICPSISRLEIVQHKGNTFLSIQPDDE